MHYCWFGKAKKSDLISECIDTWKKHLPDFELKEWNEDNAIIDCEFAVKAFQKKKWAFVSDYVRLEVLYKYGGIYLDTDMFLIKPLHDLLHHSCFLGKQEEQLVNACIIGSVPNHAFIKKCIDEYKMLKFDEHRMANIAIPNLITRLYNLYILDNKDVKLYEPDFFYPYSTFDNLVDPNFLNYIKPNSYSAHLWNASWFSKKEIAGFYFERKRFLKGFLLMFEYVAENPSYLLKIPSHFFRYIKRYTAV